MKLQHLSVPRSDIEQLAAAGVKKDVWPIGSESEPGASVASSRTYVWVRSDGLTLFSVGSSGGAMESRTLSWDQASPTMTRTTIEIGVGAERRAFGVHARDRWELKETIESRCAGTASGASGGVQIVARPLQPRTALDTIKQFFWVGVLIQVVGGIVLAIGFSSEAPCGDRELCTAQLSDGGQIGVAVGWILSAIGATATLVGVIGYAVVLGIRAAKDA